VNRQLNHIDDKALLTELAARLAVRPPPLDWVASYAVGDALKSDAAAVIAGCSAQTIRRRAEDAADTHRPLGVLLAGSVWLISLARLFDWIECHEGMPERLAAETRASKLAQLSASPQQSLRSGTAATG
jgi:hypothetical protein